jgi:hypothetical protein
MYINLVQPEYRIRKVEGGWTKRPEEPEEKRKVPMGRTYSRPYRPYRPRPYLGGQHPELVAERAAEILEARNNKNKEESFPAMPESRNPSAVQIMMWPETDVPNITYQL